MESLLSHGSLGVMFAVLVLAGFGLPFPEDVVLLSAGALAHRHVVSIEAAAFVCFSGVLVGDLVIFSTARRLGPAALERPLFRRVLTPARRARVENLFARHGSKVVFFARHVAGLRTAAFAMAGMQKMPFGRFILWDAMALCLSAPLYIGLGYLFSDHIDDVRAGVVRVEHVVVAILVLAVVIYGVAVLVKRRRPHGDDKA